MPYQNNNNMKNPMFGNMNSNPPNLRVNGNFGPYMKGYPGFVGVPPPPPVQKVNVSMINNSNVHIKINVQAANDIKMDGFLNNNTLNNSGFINANGVNNNINNNNGFRGGNMNPNNKEKNVNNNPNFAGFAGNINNNNNGKNPAKRKNSNHFNEFEDSDKKNKKIKENDMEFSFFNNNQKTSNLNFTESKAPQKMSENGENLDINKSKNISIFLPSYQIFFVFSDNN